MEKMITIMAIFVAIICLFIGIKYNAINIVLAICMIAIGIVFYNEDKKQENNEEKRD